MNTEQQTRRGTRSTARRRRPKMDGLMPDGLILVRVRDLKPGHRILVDGVFHRVREVTSKGTAPGTLAITLRDAEDALHVSREATVKLLPDPPVNKRQLHQRRRELAECCNEKAQHWMRETYGAVDYEEAEWRDRLAWAAQGAARDLARTGELKQLGIDRPAQISSVRCTAAVEPDGEVTIFYDFTGTDLEALPPPPAPANGA